MAIAEAIEVMKPDFTKLSDSIWDFAELKFEETRSSEVLARALEDNGFSVRRGVAGMDTAFVGDFGAGKPVIAFLGEFDALAGMSQVANVAAHEAMIDGATGHGCGHNLLGVGSLMAAIALAKYMKANNLPGTVRLSTVSAQPITLPSSNITIASRVLPLMRRTPPISGDRRSMRSS